METILVATDFSKPANNAVEYAANLARFLNSKLVIVHGFSLPLGGYDMAAPMVTISDIRRNAVENLELIRDELVRKSYDPGIEIYAELGTTMDVIRDTANKCGAELIVMGMVGEAGRIKQYIGSNTLQVARELSIPLLIISEHVNYKPVHHICLAAELDKIEESTLLYSARGIANTFGATLEIVTVETAEKPKAHSPEVYSFIESRLHNTKHKQVLIHENDKAQALEYYFKFHETDLVIVNPRKHNFFKELFSASITRHLAFHVKVPLLVIH